LVAAVRHKTRL